MRRSLLVLGLILAAAPWPLPARAAPDPEFKTRAPFERAAEALASAVQKNKMGLVCRASAQRGAAAIGIKIRGNQVLGVFRPDYAVRMLKASVAAGIEAPVRIYIFENEDGTATITYKKPSEVFRPYGSTELDKMAAELDAIFQKIVEDALAAAP